MPVLNRIASFADDMKEWRRHIHQHPELAFACHGTAEFIVERLREFGITQIETGIATSGIVAVIDGKTPDGPVTGLRADMDALPMDEATGRDWSSQVPGRMHACGHDGHVTMLLGAARYLAESRNFPGRVVLIFQPAEEDGGGGGVMVDEGILDRYGIQEVYALHTLPGFPLGTFATTPGPIMAAVDTFDITIDGVGGHAAYPNENNDPIIAAVGIAQAIQTIVSRNSPPNDKLVVSITQMHAGSANNVTPQSAWINGTVRSFSPTVRDLVEKRIIEIVDGQAATYGVKADLKYTREYPATINHAPQTQKALQTAATISGRENIIDDLAPEMGAEDFSYMLEQRPGSYLFLGQGDGPSVHNPGFDFNDEAAPIGASFFARLIEDIHGVPTSAASPHD